MTKPCILAFVCAACVVDVGGAPAPPQPTEDPGPICADPRYADGVCTTDLACEVPDLDCFQTFKDDTVAALWYAEREADKAIDEGRPARALIPPTDPRFLEIRALYDEAWLAFKQTRPVGRLVVHRPALVMIEDDKVNAFVMANSTTRKQAFCVMVNSGLRTAPFGEEGRVGLL